MLIKFFERKFPALFLWPLSVVYGLVTTIRNIFYDLRICKSVHVGCPVICVGNITVGGTGKTPTIIYLCRFLQKLNLKVAVVSRGYGRNSKGTVLVCDGNELMATPAVGGDEPVMIAQQTMAIMVVDKDRVRGAQFIVEQFNPDVILMDDGFQHRRLHRDIDLLTVRPHYSFGNRFLLPAGPLRERILPGLKRCDAILVNGAGSFRIQSQKPIFQSAFQPIIFKNLNHKLELSAAKGKKAFVFSGIANPNSFYETLFSVGIQIVKVNSFPDHHVYTKSDFSVILKNVEQADYVFTTEKDWVKLPSEVREHTKLYALHVALQPCDEKEYQNFIKHRLKSVSMLYKKTLAF